MFNEQQEKIYYVYTYSTLDGEVFYVGKGKEDRLYYHLAEAKSKKLRGRINYPKVHKIREILRSGQEPIIQKVAESLSETEAFELEIKLIAEIGRYDLGKGPLLNMTDGGEGISGNVCSEERKKKISKANKGRVYNEEALQNFKNKPRMKQETKNKIAESKKKKIKQLDKNNNLIKIWDSIDDAVTQLQAEGYSVYDRNVSACCRGVRKTCGGFKWEFI